jgi:5-methylcytosine-specific restriction protein B
MAAKRTNSSPAPAVLSDDAVLDELLSQFPRSRLRQNTVEETDDEPETARYGGRYSLSQAPAVSPTSIPLQLLVYGCPGSGKSHYLHETCAAEVSHTITIVFHPETVYADFVGVYRPCPIYGSEGAGGFTDESGRPREHGEPFVTYEFVPGPLIDAYCFAKTNPLATVALIIEEISRANAALAFGDMLQLLDRSDGGGDVAPGESVYAIQPKPEIANYLLKHGCASPHDATIRFPANLYIWATMNRADQNARQLDAAFLRRWRKRYLSFAASCVYGDTPVELPGGKTTTWDTLRSAINARLEGVVPEDKLIGPYFLPQSSLSSKESIADDLLGYLWSDVLKSRTAELFLYPSFAHVRDAWIHGTDMPLTGIALG